MDEWSPRQLSVLAGMLFAGIIAVFMEQGVTNAPVKAVTPAEVFAQRNPFPKVPDEVMDSLASRPSSSVTFRTLGEPINDIRDSVVDVSTRTAAKSDVPSPAH
ncbi:MAG: hypothetical protein WC728_11090 [Elusimicrobiota bacterium]